MDSTNAYTFNRPQAKVIQMGGIVGLYPINLAKQDIGFQYSVKKVLMCIQNHMMYKHNFLAYVSNTNYGLSC